jgi:hypothetical protein
MLVSFSGIPVTLRNILKVLWSFRMRKTPLSSATLKQYKFQPNKHIDLAFLSKNIYGFFFFRKPNKKYSVLKAIL